MLNLFGKITPQGYKILQKVDNYLDHFKDVAVISNNEYDDLLKCISRGYERLCAKGIPYKGKLIKSLSMRRNDNQNDPV